MGNFQNIVWLFGALRGKEKILNHEDTKGTKIQENKSFFFVLSCFYMKS
jgi:hypothetical protein